MRRISCRGDNAGMTDNPLAQAILRMKDFFDRSTSCLEESDSGFAPAPGMYTVAQQAAHVAETIDWFVEGAFRPEGFSVDFGGLDQAVRRVQSLEEARAWLDRAVKNAVETVARENMEAPIVEGPILGGAPRSAIIPAMADHTAHHRGALTVYARLCGKTPSMPYGDAPSE